jgi:hypothetical protein
VIHSLTKDAIGSSLWSVRTTDPKDATESAQPVMTEKDDPSRVALGWNGHERRRPLQKDSSGNGADGNGTATGGSPAFPDSAEAVGFSSSVHAPSRKAKQMSLIAGSRAVRRLRMPRHQTVRSSHQGAIRGVSKSASIWSALCSGAGIS